MQEVLVCMALLDGVSHKGLDPWSSAEGAWGRDWVSNRMHPQSDYLSPWSESSCHVFVQVDLQEVTFLHISQFTNSNLYLANLHASKLTISACIIHIPMYNTKMFFLLFIWNKSLHCAGYMYLLCINQKERTANHDFELELLITSEGRKAMSVAMLHMAHCLPFESSKVQDCWGLLHFVASQMQTGQDDSLGKSHPAVKR